jgi:hypothetical protein
MQLAESSDSKREKGSAKTARKRVFVITPLGAEGSPERLHADWVLNAAIKPVFDPAGYDVFRSDTIDDPSMINDAIFNHIFEDEACVADLSFTNANVFYELGVRHSVLKPVIHIAHEQVSRIPFDNAQHRAIFFTLSDWHSIERLKLNLIAQLAAIEADDFVISNPITHARGRIKVSESGDENDKLLSDVIARVSNLERKIRSDHNITYDHILPSNVNRIFGLSQNKSASDTISDEVRRISSDILIESIVQFMAGRHGAPRDEIISDFYGKFGQNISAMTQRDRENLHYAVTYRSRSDQIDSDLLQQLLNPT